MKKLMFAASMLALSAPCAFAQSSPAEIRSMLGGPIDIEQGALFAATRASYKDLCGEDPEFEMQASIVNRLQYGSLDAGADKDLFRQMMIGQAQSNATIFQGLDPSARDGFCDGLNRTITGMAADFVEAHPVLFPEADQPAPAEDDGPGLEEQIRKHIADLDPNLRLYVIKMAENAVFEDFQSLAANPENDTPEGQLWLFKVISSEMVLLSFAAAEHYPDISDLYVERGELYARLVRGELDWDEMGRLEPENETTKKETFMAHFDALQRANPDLDPDMNEAEAAIKELSSMVIGGGKYLSVAN